MTARRSRGGWAEAARTTVAGAIWPAVLTGRAASLAAAAAQLEATQWLAPEALGELQLRQLGALVDHALADVPFYRDRLTAAGVASGAALTFAAWARIPVLDRPAVQEHGPELRSATLPESHGAVQEVATSGSTGRPIRVLKTELAGFYRDAQTIRAAEWAGWDRRGTQAAIRWYPDGIAQYPEGGGYPDWGAPYAFLCETGPSFALSVSATAVEQAEWLERVDPEYLTVFPSILPALIEACAARGTRPAGLRAVRTIGEWLDPAVRELVRSRWDVGIEDVYSAQEIGYIALQCPEHEHLHVQSEGALVEVLDEHDRPCGPGETGRVVVTPLHNFAMPLLRYAIGDYAEAGPPCSCGRGLPVLKRVLGRARNTVLLPDGNRVWPRLSELRYNEVLPVRQFQVVQTAATRLEVRLVAARRGTPEEETQLAEIIRARIGYPFAVSFAYVEEIARGAGGKFEEFRSELG